MVEPAKEELVHSEAVVTNLKMYDGSGVGLGSSDNDDGGNRGARATTNVAECDKRVRTTHMTVQYQTKITTVTSDVQSLVKTTGSSNNTSITALLDKSQSNRGTTNNDQRMDISNLMRSPMPHQAMTTICYTKLKGVLKRTRLRRITEDQQLPSE